MGKDTQEIIDEVRAELRDERIKELQLKELEQRNKQRELEEKKINDPFFKVMQKYK